MHQLGIRTHAEYQRLPATDQDRWRYFFAKEPAGHFVENWRWGVAVSSIINIMARSNAQNALSPSDIYPLAHQQPALHKPADPSSVLKLLNSLGRKS